METERHFLIRLVAILLAPALLLGVAALLKLIVPRASARTLKIAGALLSAASFLMVFVVNDLDWGRSEARSLRIWANILVPLGLIGTLVGIYVIAAGRSRDP